MTKDEALRLALEALERSVATCFDQYAHEQVMSRPEHFVNQAITAIKEALAQPEKEPLEYWNAVEGWVKIDEVREHFGSVGCGTIYKTAGEDRTPLYTTPPQREFVGLTKEEIAEFDTWHDHREEEVGWCNPSEIVAYIEAKLRSKNNV
jgi:hypothetical protein